MHDNGCGYWANRYSKGWGGGCSLGAWLFRSMKEQRKKAQESDGVKTWGEEKFKLIGWSWNQHIFNAAWQQVDKCPISSHYCPTSLLPSSFILRSWANLSFPCPHRGTAAVTHTHNIRPPNLRRGSWGMMSSSVTDREWLSLSLHWAYSGSTMRPKGWLLACPVWRHLWLCRSK